MESRNNTKFTLFSLSTDVIREVIPLDASSIIYLARTCRYFRFLFIHSREYPLALSLLRKLLSHAVLGEWEDAEKLWQLFPDLLACKGTIYHPNRSYEKDKIPVDIPIEINPGSYKYKNLTAWQIAMANEEFDETLLMGKYMRKYEKRKQFAEIFPDGKIIKHDWDAEEAKRLLHAVFIALIEDTGVKDNTISKIGEPLKTALHTLYHYVKSKKEYTTGLVSDANLFVEAQKIYDERCDEFPRWDHRSFWTIRVEEWLAAALGTGFLRIHAQGPGNVLHRRGCLLNNGSSYFTFRRAANSIPGFLFFIGFHGDAGIFYSDKCCPAQRLFYSDLVIRNEKIKYILSSLIFTKR